MCYFGASSKQPTNNIGIVPRIHHSQSHHCHRRSIEKSLAQTNHKEPKNNNTTHLIYTWLASQAL